MQDLHFQVVFRMAPEQSIPHLANKKKGPAALQLNADIFFQKFQFSSFTTPGAMGNCCGQATNETEFVLWSPALEKLEPHRDPHRRALEAKTMQQIPKAGRSCFVCYTCAAPDQAREGDDWGRSSSFSLLFWWPGEKT
eukprot:symbB.v1.2.000330.t1/scaffold6.1/size569917/33